MLPSSGFSVAHSTNNNATSLQQETLKFGCYFYSHSMSACIPHLHYCYELLYILNLNFFYSTIAGIGFKFRMNVSCVEPLIIYKNQDSTNNFITK